MVKANVLAFLGGTTLKILLKQVGIPIAQKLLAKQLGEVLTKEVMKKIIAVVGRKVFTKAGTKSFLNIAKVVPILGGVIGGVAGGIETKLFSKKAIEEFEDLYLEKITLEKN